MAPLFSRCRGHMMSQCESMIKRTVGIRAETFNSWTGAFKSLKDKLSSPAKVKSILDTFRNVQPKAKYPELLHLK